MSRSDFDSIVKKYIISSSLLNNYNFVKLIYKLVKKMIIFLMQNF